MHICVQAKTVWTHASTFASYPKTLKTEEKAWNQSDSQTPQKKKKNLRNYRHQVTLKVCMYPSM